MVRMSEGHLQCVHTIRFSELTKNLQFGAKAIMQNLSVPFIFQGAVSDENRACSISIRLFKIKDPFDGRSFLMCSHDPFFGTNKNRILKNGSCERALRWRKNTHGNVLNSCKGKATSYFAFKQALISNQWYFNTEMSLHSFTPKNTAIYQGVFSEIPRNSAW